MASPISKRLMSAGILNLCKKFAHEEPEGEEAKLIVRIMQTPIEKRTHRENHLLASILKNVQFFQERNLSETELHQVAQALRYEHFGEGETIFEHGTFGNTFYIIIEGGAKVFMPKFKEDEGESVYSEDETPNDATPPHPTPDIEQKPSSSNLPIKIVTPQPMTHSNKMIENFSRRATAMTKKRSQKVLAPIKETVGKGKINLMGITVETFDDVQENETEEEDEGMLEVACIPSGGSFGELALITNKTRSATVRASKNSHIAVMKRWAFEKILKSIEIKALNEITDFLISLPYFNMCSKREIHKLHYYFRKQFFHKGELVYRSGDLPTDIYIVKGGQFSMETDVTKVQRKEIHCKDYLGGGGHRKRELGDRVVGSMHTRMDSDLLCILGFGQMFSEDDVIFNRKHLATVKCMDFRGELLVCHANDFVRGLRHLRSALGFITDGVLNKREAYKEKLVAFNRRQGYQELEAELEYEKEGSMFQGLKRRSDIKGNMGRNKKEREKNGELVRLGRPCSAGGSSRIEVPHFHNPKIAGTEYNRSGRQGKGKLEINILRMFQSLRSGEGMGGKTIKEPTNVGNISNVRNVSNVSRRSISSKDPPETEISPPKERKCPGSSSSVSSRVESPSDYKSMEYPKRRPQTQGGDVGDLVYTPSPYIRRRSHSRDRKTNLQIPNLIKVNLDTPFLTPYPPNTATVYPKTAPYTTFISHPPNIKILLARMPKTNTKTKTNKIRPYLSKSFTTTPRAHSPHASTGSYYMEQAYTMNTGVSASIRVKYIYPTYRSQ